MDSTPASPTSEVEAAMSVSPGTASHVSAERLHEKPSPAQNPRQGDFKSEIFTILVGPNEERFTAHEDMLAESKVLRAHCSGGFEEQHSKVIKLKESDPEIFALVLEYLYCGDYWPRQCGESRSARSEDVHVRATQMQREADLYCMADYYDLPALQDIVVAKMTGLMPLTLNFFLDISEYIYENTGSIGYRGPFREYFQDTIRDVARTLVRPWVAGKDHMCADFVQDLFLSLIPETVLVRDESEEVLIGWIDPPRTGRCHVQIESDSQSGDELEWRIAEAYVSTSRLS